MVDPGYKGYSFTLSELKYLRSGKYVCPRCGGQMEKEKYSAEVSPEVFDTSVIHANYTVTQYKYRFRFGSCGEVFELEELVPPKKHSPMVRKITRVIVIIAIIAVLMSVMIGSLL